MLFSLIRFATYSFFPFRSFISHHLRGTYTIIVHAPYTKVEWNNSNGYQKWAKQEKDEDAIEEEGETEKSRANRTARWNTMNELTHTDNRILCNG